jgi:hypothetical protein
LRRRVLSRARIDEQIVWITTRAIPMMQEEEAALIAGLMLAGK